MSHQALGFGSGRSLIEGSSASSKQPQPSWQSGVLDIDYVPQRARMPQGFKAMQQLRHVAEELGPPPAVVTPKPDSRAIAFIEEHKTFLSTASTAAPSSPTCFSSPTSRARLTAADLREVTSQWPSTTDEIRRACRRSMPGPPRCAAVMPKRATIGLKAKTPTAAASAQLSQTSNTSLLDSPVTPEKKRLLQTSEATATSSVKVTQHVEEVIEAKTMEVESLEEEKLPRLNMKKLTRMNSLNGKLELGSDAVDTKADQDATKAAYNHAAFGCYVKDHGDLVKTPEQDKCQRGEKLGATVAPVRRRSPPTPSAASTGTAAACPVRAAAAPLTQLLQARRSLRAAVPRVCG